LKNIPILTQAEYGIVTNRDFLLIPRKEKWFVKRYLHFQVRS